MHKQRQKSFSSNTPLSARRNHIVEDSLNKKNDLIDKYQQEIQDLLQQINTKDQSRKANTQHSQPLVPQKSIKRNSRIISSNRKPTVNQPQRELIVSGSMKDYQKLILGLQYALQTEKKKIQGYKLKNSSLELQVSNLRNVLVGPNESKQYQRTIMKELEAKINQLQQKAIDQKKNYQFIIESKNEALTNMQNQIRIIRKQIEHKLAPQDSKNKVQAKENIQTKKILELMSTIEELRTSVTRKNIQIQSLKYKKMQLPAQDSDQSDDQIKRIRKIERIKFYLGQLQIANKMIIKKNIQILNLSNKIMNQEEVLDVVEMYLDKKEVKNIDLSILQTSVITKLRILLREKATFERELLAQLNEHNKKISTFQNEITVQESATSNKLAEVIADNKKLTALINNLQLNTKNLEKSLQDQRRQNEYLKNELEINKKQFVEEIKRLKGQLGTISSVTKNEFDKMKIQNLKLSEQNRSLLFLVGQKERQIHKKGQTLKTFEDYRQKINSLDVSINQAQKRKIERVSEDVPQLGSKLLLISSFTAWMFEWNKIKSWNNKKVLLNLILDKQSIRTDSLGSMNLVIDVLHECFLHSNNVQIQQRAIILMESYIAHNIMKHHSLYLQKIAPLILRGFRPKIQGQQQSKHRLLNESTLKIVAKLQKQNFEWTNAMTNQMLSVNGLKYLFVTIQQGSLDDLIEMAYEVLIMITKQNEMISFMISYNLAEMMIKNMNSKYAFVLFVMELLKNLLNSSDFLRSQKSLLEYRKITSLLKADDDDELIEITLECLQILLQQHTFNKSLNKLETLAILSNILKKNSDFKLLKKLGVVYGQIIEGLEDDNMDRFIKIQVEKLCHIIDEKKINDVRFKRSLGILLKAIQQVSQRNDLDQKAIKHCVQLYELYESIQDKTCLKLNEIIQTVYDRNKEAINKFSSDQFITNLVEAYKTTKNLQEISVLLKILLFQNEQKHTTQVLRAGRQTYIDKLATDAMTSNYQISIMSLKNLLAIARQKYTQKYINIKIVSKIVNKVLKERGQQEYLSLAISVLYFLSKNQQISTMAVECNAVEKVASVMTERHNHQALIFKCFALLQLLHTMNYKKKVLNFFLTNDPKLQIFKTFNYILRRAQNKTQMGARAVFFYDYMLNKGSLQSLTILMENNDWMVSDLITMRNQYIGKVDSLVYKIQLLLNGVCQRSKKLNKLYQRFKVQGDISSGDEEN